MTDKARSAGEVTDKLHGLNDNRRGNSADALLKLVYGELRRQAHRHLQKERIGHTLQTTALVHEIFIRLIL